MCRRAPLRVLRDIRSEIAEARKEIQQIKTLLQDLIDFLDNTQIFKEQQDD